MNTNNMLDLIGETPGRYIQDAAPRDAQASHSRPAGKPLLIAAMIALMICLLGCAVVLMDLSGLILTQDLYPHRDTAETAPADTISLQGFIGSPGYQAALEWMEFRASYDPDLQIRQSLTEEEMEMPLDYYSYSCYTTEMTDKVDEICEKYGLSKQGKPAFDRTTSELLEALRIDTILDSEADAEVNLRSGYCYQSGTFMLSCDAVLTDEVKTWEPIECQISCVMKTDFDDTCLNIGDVESYEQWTTVTSDGTEILLALSPEKALILVDKETCFVSVNIVYPKNLDNETLAAFSQIFDFSFSPQAISDEAWAELQAG